jgi:uncharacterized glyoxalase superfamily protein PhnB
MSTVRRVAPIFPVSDLAHALAHYERLGFETREYVGGGYGYVTRDSVEIHLSLRDADPNTTTSAAYLWVEDADALAREWAAAGVAVTTPRDTDWAQHEGSHIDPFGNLIRFGSPVQHPASGAGDRERPSPRKGDPRIVRSSSSASTRYTY